MSIQVAWTSTEMSILVVLIAAATAADIFTIDYPDRKGISGGYIFPCVAAVVLGAVGAGLVAGAGRLLAISVGGPGRRWAPLWGIVNGALAFLAAWVGSAIAPLGRGSVGSSLVGAGGFAASYTGSSLALVMLKRRLVGGPDDYPRLDVVTNALLLPLALGLVVAYLRDGTNALVLAAAFLVALLIIVRTSVNLKTANGELQRAYGDLDQQRDELTAALGLNREYGRVFSHDLRGQLTAITGNAELAVRGLARPGASLQDQARHLDRILHNGRRMVRLIDSLGLLSQTEQDSASLELTPLDAAAVVTQVTDDLRPAAEDRGAALELRITCDDCQIVTSEWMLREIVDNLLSNAIKYTAEGGHVWVRLDRSATGLRLEVQDDGVGISPEDQQKIFTHFFRSSASGVQAMPGTGLGLALTRGMVERLGGDISFMSELGRGSQFVVSLRSPAAPGQ